MRTPDGGNTAWKRNKNSREKILKTTKGHKER
jgi:hypothetical protein